MSLTGSAKAGGKVKGKINRLNMIRGYSAYEVAVINGFSGTEEEWLKSLEMSPEQVDEAVAQYMKENPVAIDGTLSKSGEAADAKATGDAIKALQNHANNKENPHGVTAAQVGARPDTWMPSASDVGARPDTWMPTAAEVGARPNTWTPTAQDVGARPINWMPTANEVGARPDTWMPSAEDVGAVTEAQVTNIVNDALGVIENGSY